MQRRLDDIESLAFTKRAQQREAAPKTRHAKVIRWPMPPAYPSRPSAIAQAPSHPLNRSDDWPVLLHGRLSDHTANDCRSNDDTGYRCDPPDNDPPPPPDSCDPY